jgi:two-component system phosphate regulon sensor histidine kinase PhoR
MSIALAGIISLQVYWITHDIKIKEQQFDQTVNQVMNSIVDRIETNEALNILNERVFRIDPSRITELMIRDTSTGIPVIITDTSVEIPPHAIKPPPIVDDLENADINIEFHKPGTNQTFLRVQRRNVVHRDSNSQHTIHSSQVTRIYGDSAEVTIRQNEEKIKARLEKLNDVMEKMAIEFAGPDNDVKARLDSTKLDSIVRYELMNKGIDLDVNYGVLNGSNNSFLISNSKVPPATLMKSKYKTLLFPNDIISKPDFLILHFPDSMRYVLSSMWLMVLTSSLFTFVILFGFAYTIHVIFRQKKLSDIKTDFINNMTHEFKTPIATISLAVDSIKDPRVKTDAEKFDYFTRIIREENRRMNSQVENVLQMAQIEKGELNLRKEEVNLHSIILQAIDLISLQVENKGGKIESRLDAQLPVLKGDRIHLSNVIFNLLDNANKYTPDRPLINVETGNLRNGIYVRITDNGVGMSKDTLKKIFDKFYRVPTGNLHDIKGFGLGLSYVKAIVERHGGYITVDSEPGKGSTFQFFLPLKTGK